MNTTSNILMTNAGNLLMSGDPAFAPDMPAAALLPQALVPAAAVPALPLNFATALLSQQQELADIALPTEEAVLETQGTLAQLAQSLQLAEPSVEEAAQPSESSEASDDTLAAQLLNLPAQQAPLPVMQQAAPLPLAEDAPSLGKAPQQAAQIAQAALPAAEKPVAAAPAEAQTQAAAKPALAASAAPMPKADTGVEKGSKPQAAAVLGAVPGFASILSAAEPASASGAAPVLTLPTIKLAGEQAASAPSQLLQALGDRIQLQIAARSEQAVIRLDPPQMGRVDIAIARQEGGVIDVRMSASHGEVQRQLQQGSETLRWDLAQRHGGEVSVQVVASPRETADSRGSSQRQPSQQQQEQAESRQPGRALNSGAGEQPATPFALA